MTVSPSTVRDGRGPEGLRQPRDFVFTFSYETYSDARSRGMMRPPDRLLCTLMESPDVRRLLVANPYRSVVSAAARSLASVNAKFPSSESRRLHTPIRLRRADPTSVRAIDGCYAAYGRSLHRVARSLELVDPVVITANPLTAAFGRFDWASSVIYYARDDWSSSPSRERYWPAYREAYRRIAESGTAVAAVSQQIIDRIQPTGPHLVVPNGVDPDEWSGPRPAEPEWFSRIPGDRAVYVGTLDSRLDVEGLLRLADAKPHLQLVLLGPLPDPGYVAPLRSRSNVHIHGGVGRAELVATLRNAQLCLVAHRRTELTAAMSPLKIYEYLAAGAPVLSIDLPPVRGIDDRVTLVDSVADFVDVVDSALARGTATDEERASFIESNSWPARHERILSLSA